MLNAAKLQALVDELRDDCDDVDVLGPAALMAKARAAREALTLDEAYAVAKLLINGPAPRTDAKPDPRKPRTDRRG